MNDFIDKLWNELNRFNLSTIYLFYIDEKKLTYDFTPTYSKEPYTKAWINFNFNLNKVVETLKLTLALDDDKHPYYIMCDSALILLVSAFESYFTSNYNNIRKLLSKEENEPKLPTFQRKETLKEKYGEMDINIAHLDENLWREIFSSSKNDRGIIRLRNIIVHNGWKGFKKKSDMINHIYVKESIFKIIKFIKIVDKIVIKKYPNLNNLKNAN